MKRFQFSFEEIDYENPIHDRPMSSELSVHLSDESTWVEVMGFFASFLEGIGYVDVRKKLEEKGVVEDVTYGVWDETPSNS